MQNMKNEKLAQNVASLRKRQSLSQKELAEKSGVSLRTIQRVENGETEPTGETLKRIASSFGITPNELMERDENKQTPKRTIKTKFEYLHIYNNKLVFSKNKEINNLVEDYEESVSNLFKSLMVFFVFIPLFSVLSIIFYNLEKTELAINTGAYAFLFLVVAFNTMLFTSGSAIIYLENIDHIKIQRKLFQTVVIISYTKLGRKKDRTLLLEKKQVENVKNILLSEKLIKEQDVNTKHNKLDLNTAFIILYLIVSAYLILFEKSHEMIVSNNAAMVLFATSVLAINMIVKLLIPLFNKTENR